jgi:hypothetical protein
MNYFAHACRFLDDPCFLAGTGVPDWLSVCDRGVRVRAKRVAPAVETWEGPTLAVARGVLQHLHDDAWFHDTRDFAELMLAITAMVRQAAPSDSGLRAGFFGHLLVELLLDAALIADDPGRLDEYYHLLDRVDAAFVEETVNRLVPRPTDRLARMIATFRQARILWDYLEDARLLVRVNQVLGRVGLEPLPERFRDTLAEARRLVAARRESLFVVRGALPVIRDP